jgi:peptidoglycan hydrolase CwlO-like protein
MKTSNLILSISLVLALSSSGILGTFLYSDHEKLVNVELNLKDTKKEVDNLRWALAEKQADHMARINNLLENIEQYKIIITQREDQIRTLALPKN